MATTNLLIVANFNTFSSASMEMIDTKTAETYLLTDRLHLVYQKPKRHLFVKNKVSPMRHPVTVPILGSHYDRRGHYNRSDLQQPFSRCVHQAQSFELMDMDPLFQKPRIGQRDVKQHPYVRPNCSVLYYNDLPWNVISNPFVTPANSFHGSPLDPLNTTLQHEHNAQGTNSDRTSTSSWLPTITASVVVDPTVTGYLEHLSQTSEKLTSVLDSISTHWKKLVDYLVKDASLESWIADRILQLLLSIINLYQAQTWTHRITLLTQTILSWGVSVSDKLITFLLAFKRLFFKFFDDESKNEKDTFIGEKEEELLHSASAFGPITHSVMQQFQALEHVAQTDDDSDCFESFHNTFVDWISEQFSMNIKNRISYSTFTSFAAKLTTAKNFVQAIQVLSDYAMKFFMYSYEKIFGVPFSTTETQKLVAAAVEWSKRAQEYTSNLLPETLANNSTFRNSLRVHYSDGKLLLPQIIKAGYGQNNFASFFKVYQGFETIAKMAEEIEMNGRDRPEPGLYEFSGQAGVGKTHIMNQFGQDMYQWYCEFAKIPYHPGAKTVRYEKNKDDPYWDMYFGQFQTTFDDVWQHDDEEIRTLIALMLMQMRGVAPMPLNAAACEMKGRLYFTSKIVTTTSNTISAKGDWKIVNLNVQELPAFYRRYDAFWESDLNDGFFTMVDTIDGKTGQSTQRKQITKEGLLRYRESYKFRLWNAETKRPFKQWITYDQMLAHSAAILLSKLNTHTEMTEASLKEVPVVSPKLMSFDIDETYVPPTQTLPPKSLKGKNRSKPADYYRKVSKQEAEGFGVLTRPISLFKWAVSEAIKVDVFAPPIFSVHDVAYTVRSTLVDPDEGRLVTTPHGEAIAAPDGNLYFADAPKVLTDETVSLLKQTSSSIEAENVAKSACSLNLIRCDFTRYIIGTLSVIGTLFGFYKFYEWMTPSQSADTHAAATPKDIGISIGGGASHKPQPKKASSKVPRKLTLLAQGDPSANMLATDCIIKNCVRVSFYRDEQYPARCINSFGFFISGRRLSIPYHMVEPFYNPTTRQYVGFVKITYRNNAKDIVQTDVTIPLIDVIRVFKLDEIDWSIIVFNETQIKEFPDVSHHFCTFNEIANGKINQGFLMVPEPAPILKATDTIERIGGFPYKSAQGFDYYNHETFNYCFQTLKGWCFSPLFIENTHFSGKIAGFHISGDNVTSGHAVEISREMVHDANEAIDEQLAILKKIRLESEHVPQMDFKLEIPNGLEYVGPAPQHLFNRQPDKSQIQPSIIQNLVVPTTKRPAALKFDRVKNQSPLQNALSRWKKNPKGLSILTEAEVNETIDYVLAEIVPHVSEDEISFHQVINGVPLWEHGHGLHMSTSAGPNTTQVKKTGTGKSYLFREVITFEGSYFEMIPELQQRVDALEAAYQQGLTYQAYQALMLKDELRDHDRVDAMKTRDFACLEVAHLILGRKYFAGFIENILCSRKTSGITLGIDPKTPEEWDWVIRGHNIKDPIYDPYDVAHADREYNEVLLRLLVEKILARLPGSTSVTQIRRGILSDMTITQLVIIGGEIYKTVSAQFASGGFITAHMQSLYYKNGSRLALKAANKRLMLATEEEIIDYFTNIAGDVSLRPTTLSVCYPDNSKLASRHNGDDTVLIRSALLLGWYNLRVQQYEMAEFGIDITPTDKSKVFKLAYSIDELDFLKRSFKWVNGIMRCPLQLTTILEVLNWVNTRRDPREQIIQNVQWVCEELWQHGVETYDEYVPRIRSALLSQGLVVVLPTYNDLSFDMLAGKRVLTDTSLSFIDTLVNTADQEAQSDGSLDHCPNFVPQSWTNLFDCITSKTHNWDYSVRDAIWITNLDEGDYFPFFGKSPVKTCSRENLARILLVNLFRDNFYTDKRPNGTLVYFIKCSNGTIYTIATDYYHNSLKTDPSPLALQAFN